MKILATLSAVLALGISIAGCAAPTATKEQPLPERNSTALVTKRLLQKYATTPDNLAAALTTNPDADGDARETLRWEKRILQVAVTRYSGAYAGDVAVALYDLETVFDKVDRHILICLREKDPDLLDQLSGHNGISACYGREADIELIFDATDRPKKDRHTLVPPMPPADSAIADFWQDRTRFYNAAPTREACDFLASAGSGGDGIAGAAAIIRSRSQEVGRGHGRLCIDTLGYALLGAVRARLEGTDLSAAYTPELLDLLYSDRVHSGLAREDLKGILAAAATE